MRSYSEIETIIKRATKAIGFSWGISEEVGKNIKLIEMFGLPGLKNLNQYFKIYNISNFEILKWPVGEYHDWHTDTIYYDKTTITYLNKGYKGGRTTVDNYTVEPETGKIILFDSGIRHKVSPLIEGERYVILVWYNLINLIFFFYEKFLF